MAQFDFSDVVGAGIINATTNTVFESQQFEIAVTTDPVEAFETIINPGHTGLADFMEWNITSKLRGSTLQVATTDVLSFEWQYLENGGSSFETLTTGSTDQFQTILPSTTFLRTGVVSSGLAMPVRLRCLLSMDNTSGTIQLFLETETTTVSAIRVVGSIT